MQIKPLGRTPWVRSFGVIQIRISDPSLGSWCIKGGRIQNMDRGPWTTLWTWSMDHPMDPVHGPSPWTTPWTTPKSQKEIAPVNIYWRSGMKNTCSYLLLTSLRVCLVIAGCFESKALEGVMLSGNLPPPRSCFV